ncbi:hypothetical protein [Thaumasiovibrio sp. DFM-14]|uniref:hypothetical protein n=1 Tax=Thaumasiovibrio sp. DFM-14 TaxID=3384792 RepID=UPI00399FE346
MKWISGLILALVMTSSALAADDDVEFAVFSMNADIPALTESKVRMLYKGKTKKVGGSIKIVLVDMPKNSILREEFYSQLLGKSVAQMSGYWASLSFSGKGTPPDELSSEDIKDILEWLNENPNGVAYAPIEKVPEGANILVTINQGE